jgi:undecaprenyl-diphosphatase
MAGVFEMPILRFILSIFLGRIPRYIVTAFAGAIIYKTKFYATTTMSAIVLGAMQGVTEFLPVSSTGHLVIMEHFLVLPAENLYLFDIFLHGASLLAIFLFFRRDWLHVLSEIGIWFKTRRIHKDSLAFKLMIGTIPAIIAGVLFAGYIEGPLRGMNAVAISFIATGVFYLYAEWKGKHHTAETVTPKKSVIIGLAQAAALVPAVSRSGATIATGMILGLSREAAARFSFMLGGVAILAANVYALIDLDSATRLPDRYFTLTGCITSFLFSLGAIYLLLKFLRRHSLKAFSIYLMIVGVLMLSFF